MTVREILGALGSWELTLRDIPDAEWDKLGFFGHIVILRGRVEPLELYGDQLLSAARYVGVLLDRDREDIPTIGGPGMVTWLGDEDEKGQILESKVTLNAASLSTAVAAVLPSAVTLGAVHDPGGTYTGTLQFVTPRAALQKICDAFNVEFRVNGNGTVDVGTQAQLYAATPDSIVVRKGAGVDMDLVALGGRMGVQTSGRDYSDRVLLVGETTDAGTFATGSASAPSVPYKDLHGAPVKRTRMISESGETTGTVAARAQLHLNRFSRTTYAVKVTAEDYEIRGNFVVGDNTYVYDPETGLVDAANEVHFRGQVLHPARVRVTEVSWPVSEGHTVAFRTGDGVWVDLTRYVDWETGTNDLVVGDLPRSLTNAPPNPVIDRVDSLPDDIAPGPPTDLELATTSVVDTQSGQNTALILAQWTAPLLNEDGSVYADHGHYVVHFRPQFRAPLWDTRYVEGTSIDLPAVIDLDYDVEVAAVDKSGNQGAFSSVVSIHTAADLTAPSPPSDPTVSNYLGQLRIVWDGLDALGASMPPDFNRVDVHVSTATGFTPSAATLVSSLSTAGVAYATAPYATTRYVRLVAYDHTGNASSPSGTASGATAQVVAADIFNGAVGSAKLADLAVITAKIDNLAVNDAKIGSMSVGKLTAGTMSADVTISGRFATALTGTRVEVNSLGVQAWNGAAQTISLTGTTNLLTGTTQSALTGRRIVSGASGNVGRISLIAPDGTTGVFESYTGDTGHEAVRMVMPIAGAWEGWNGVQFQTNDRGYLSSGLLWLTYGGSGAGAQGFHVYEASNDGSAGVQPTHTERVRIDSGRSSVYSPDGNTEVQLTNSNVRVFVGSVDFEGSIDVQRHGVADTALRSPKLLFRSEPNGAGAFFGSSLKYVVDGDGTDPRIEVRNTADTGFGAIWASAFTVSSSREGKEQIADLSVDAALDQLRAMRVRTYRRPRSGGLVENDDGTVTHLPDQLGPVEIGLIAEEAPGEVVEGHTQAVNLYSLVAVTVAGLQRVAVRLAALEQRVSRP